MAPLQATLANDCHRRWLCKLALQHIGSSTIFLQATLANDFGAGGTNWLFNRGTPPLPPVADLQGWPVSYTSAKCIVLPLPKKLIRMACVQNGPTLCVLHVGPALPLCFVRHVGCPVLPLSKCQSCVSSSHDALRCPCSNEVLYPHLMTQ
eukprot:scaffold21828_cov22-Tisochrysis_lutea.AAC.1